ncbi:MAG: lipoprotein-releasing ABC transporter permease subunit [Candidatus Oxydemutatoraceae bacterium WSBS_2016_MAG_OTU14]
MLNRIEYRIGLRYTRSPKRNHFISFASLFSMLGIAVGIAAIITVLSVMNGFKEEIREKILNFTAHGLISSFQGNIKNWMEIEPILRENKRIVAYSSYVEMQGILKSSAKVRGALIRGIEPSSEKKVSNLEQYLSQNAMDKLRAKSWNVILGQTLARSLRVGVGDKVILLSSQTLQTPIGAVPRLRRLEVVGILNTGMSQFDSHVALVHIKDAQLITQAKESVTGIQLRYDNLFEAPEISQDLRLRLGSHYWVSSWVDRNRDFFKALEMEKLLLLIIMTLIVAVAAFNIISSLMMLIFEKRGDIAILKTLGMPRSGIVKIFMTQGCIIGLSGVSMGILGGIALAVNVERIVAGIENLTGHKFLSPEVYPITEVPSLLLFGDVAVTALIAFVLTVLATIYPSFYAAKMQASEALRYD